MKKLVLFSLVMLLAAGCVSSKVESPISSIPTAKPTSTSPTSNTQPQTTKQDEPDLDCLKSDTSGNNKLSSTISISGIIFSLPSNWKLTAQNSTQACILTQAQPYRVYLGLTVNQNDESSVDSYADAKNNSLITHTSAAELFQVACGGPISCNGAKIGKNIYNFYWYVASTQPVPTDIDGIWTPDHNFSSDDIWKVLLTIRSSN